MRKTVQVHAFFTVCTNEDSVATVTPEALDFYLSKQLLLLLCCCCHGVDGEYREHSSTRENPLIGLFCCKLKI